MLEATTVLKKSADQVSCDLDNEVAILEQKAALYYGLNEVGAHIWHLLDEPRSVDNICASVAEHFDVEGSDCLSDVLRFLASMRDAGLVETAG